MRGVRQVDVLDLYDEGVVAVEEFAGVVARRDDWDRSACGSWNCTQLARHLLAVVRYYDDWLDRAEQGESDPPFASRDLGEHNEASLNALGNIEGSDAIALFVAEARAYAHRLRPLWDLAYGYPFGTVTAGRHASVAAVEWHVHAWDLSRAVDREHRPDDAQTLFLAAGDCMSIARGGIVGATQRRLVRLAARRKPWEQILRRSGRHST